MRKVLPYIAIVILFVTGFYLALPGRSYSDPIKRSRILLGTVVEIQIRDADLEKAEDAVNKAYDEVKRIDDVFSVFNSAGPVWAINHSIKNKFQTNPEIFFVLEKCNEFNRLTNGAFDVSLDSLSELWGFGPNGNPSLPLDSKINEALKFCGWNNVKLQEKYSFYRENNVRLNFGAIAKGYAVDCAVNTLRKYGIKNALVNAGGEIKQIGNDWIVGVQDPDNRTSVIRKLKLNGMSVATSGDYEQYFEKDGVRYCHIINPATGYPAQLCKSVTVVAPDDLSADALATGLFVMGPEKGMSVVESLKGIEAYIIDKNNKEYFSSGFSKYILR
ncbi:MAG TPA: FAD:protein FMN transferase [Ignavibacteriaceae bacterium]|nr:FAD:protein FMN transferase [Ignavibacteriaceae bacterium]